MPEKASALHSFYIIDGVQQEYAPAQLLDAVTDSGAVHSSSPAGESYIMDETLDAEVRSYGYDNGQCLSYLDRVLSSARRVPMAYADSYTRFRIAHALVDSLWKGGHFRLGNLQVDAVWKWNGTRVGSMAAFYESVRSTADYVDAMGLNLSGYGFSWTEGDSAAEFKAILGGSLCDDDEVRMSDDAACPDVLVPDPQSWVVYVPFDTADFRLGGSLFSQVLGLGGAAPVISDADYFMDCHEVVREFVEDGILLSGVSVGEGGLLAAASRLTSGGTGLTVDISDVMRSYQENDAVRILFSAIPGAIIQIRDSDFDYLDAELLLQDVAYFPLGHPEPGGRLDIKASAKSGIQTILESLMRNAEGED